jgi:hypothetical protein
MSAAGSDARNIFSGSRRVALPARQRARPRPRRWASRPPCPYDAHVGPRAQAQPAFFRCERERDGDIHGRATLPSQPDMPVQQASPAGQGLAGQSAAQARMAGRVGCPTAPNRRRITACAASRRWHAPGADRHRGSPSSGSSDGPTTSRPPPPNLRTATMRTLITAHLTSVIDDVRRSAAPAGQRRAVSAAAPSGPGPRTRHRCQRVRGGSRWSCWSSTKPLAKPR